MNEASFDALEMRSCYRPLYNLHATRRTRRVHDSASLSLSLYVSKLAFSFIYTASLEAFRARGRVRITLFDKVARAAWFNETFNCTRAIVLTTGRFTPLLRASRSLKTVINDGDNHVALQTEIEFPLSNFFGFGSIILSACSFL